MINYNSTFSAVNSEQKVLKILSVWGIILVKQAVLGAIFYEEWGSKMTAGSDFFTEQTEQSAVKARIISSYFNAWARVIKKWDGEMGYIDLFCGPGRYGDNNLSAPLQIIQSTLSDPVLTKKMHFLFNDQDENNITSLKSEIQRIDSNSLLDKRIRYCTQTVDGNSHLKIRIPQGLPVLSFVDPFGYKGLTRELIDLLISNSGSDCIFFFNYNRINMALSSNTKFDEHLKSIFGADRMTSLKLSLSDLPSAQREPLVLDALISALTENKSNFVLPFKFYGQEQSRTSHFIIFVTKNRVACKIMKQIMYSNSAKDADGVATFSFEDSKNFASDFNQLSLFTGPLQSLIEDLKRKHSGESISVKKLCDDVDCDFNSHYVSKNVKEALICLETNGEIRVISGRKQMYRKGKLTMPDGAIVEFF